jgi:hypothetical protein
VSDAARAALAARIDGLILRAQHTARVPPETVRRLLSWADRDAKLKRFVDVVLIAAPADFEPAEFLDHAPSRTLCAVLLVATGANPELTPFAADLAHKLNWEMEIIRERFEADALSEARMRSVAGIQQLPLLVDGVDVRPVIADVLGAQ